MTKAELLELITEKKESLSETIAGLESDYLQSELESERGIIAILRVEKQFFYKTLSEIEAGLLNLTN